jgi:hypothetical protein
MDTDDEFEKKYREKMIKAKEDYDEMKSQEGDSDLIFNEKRPQKKIKKFEYLLVYLRNQFF